MMSQERVFKIDKVIFSNYTKTWTPKSTVFHVWISTPIQYQIMMSSVARVKVLFSYHTKGVLKFHQIRITKSKVIHVEIPGPKWEKTKKWEKPFSVTKWDNKELTNRGRF